MTRNDVIRLAREAGGGLESKYKNISALERFAELVAAAERERFVKLWSEIQEIRAKRPQVLQS